MTSYNPFAALIMGQQAAVGLPTTWGGNGGGIVPTPEQIAESEAAAAQLGIPVDTPVQEPSPEILVRGSAPAPVAPPSLDPSQYSMPDEVPNLSNSPWAQERQAVNEKNEKEIKHKGMFGMKGTLRDVLGILGDAFLVQGGADKVYAPQRQREKIGDAMAGYTQAPLAAAERVAQYDPKFGQEIYKEAQQNQVRKAQMESLNASREDMAATRAQKRFESARGYTAALLNAAGDNPEQLAAAFQQAERVAKAAGTTLQDLGVSQDMTPAQRAVYAQAGMNTYQQEGLERRDRQLDTTERQGAERIAIARKNAETARQRMLKSGGGRGGRPRADTELEYFRALEAVPASERSAEENAWVRDYTGQNSRGSGRRPVAPPPRSKSAPRIRKVYDAN